ncbi:hypothetical protein [Bacillus cereus]|uniref:hypothetical protein n=1 Tax=Bacillus cereus TaxID=1396 RepID=UPI000BF5F32B|nr:hypothetical protein [Bacillus cereus]PEQ94760.1 hypothetical protein CN477_30380 [Bacillus cereus]
MSKIMTNEFSHKLLLIICSILAVFGWLYCFDLYNRMKLQFTIYHAIVLVVPFIVLLLGYNAIVCYFKKKKFLESVIKSLITIVIVSGVFMAAGLFIEQENVIFKVLFFAILGASILLRFITYIIDKNRVYKEMKPLTK